VPSRLHQHLAVTLSILACAAATSVSLRSPARSPRTEDRNGDGRPDVWRTYDRQGRLSEVAIDTNFDGRSDVHEFYKDGALVSRESDRNFDDRIDLVEQFDGATHDQVRAVEDVDYDGTADLLILFQGGHAVFSKWAQRETPGVAGSSTPGPDGTPRTDNDPLVPFDDPFRTDLTLTAVVRVAGSGDCAGLSTAGGLPASGLEVANRPASSSGLGATLSRYAPSAILDLPSSRAPPVSRS
jgi:hypothetical protein